MSCQIHAVSFQTEVTYTYYSSYNFKSNSYVFLIKDHRSKSFHWQFDDQRSNVLFLRIFAPDVVYFDNSYSWVNAKKLSYLIEVLLPEVDGKVLQETDSTSFWSWHKTSLGDGVYEPDVWLRFKLKNKKKTETKKRRTCWRTFEGVDGK